MHDALKHFTRNAWCHDVNRTYMHWRGCIRLYTLQCIHIHTQQLHKFTQHTCSMQVL